MTEHIISTTSGKVRGHERNGRIEYLGIPYAEPPVGALRFRRAVPVKPWLDVLDARAYSSLTRTLKDSGTPGVGMLLPLTIAS